MKDLIVVAMTLAFFAIAIAYIALCDRIVGPDTDLTDVTLTDAGVDDDSGVTAAETAGGQAGTNRLEADA